MSRCDGCEHLTRLMVGLEAERDAAVHAALAAQQERDAAERKLADLRADTGGLASELAAARERPAIVIEHAAAMLENAAAEVHPAQQGWVRDVLLDAAARVRGVTG